MGAYITTESYAIQLLFRSKFCGHFVPPLALLVAPHRFLITEVEFRVQFSGKKNFSGSTYHHFRSFGLQQPVPNAAIPRTSPPFNRFRSVSQPRTLQTHINFTLFSDFSL
jgi:hypothetical protein